MAMLVDLLTYAVALAVLALSAVYVFVLVFSHTPREALPSEYSYRTNASSGEPDLSGATTNETDAPSSTTGRLTSIWDEPTVEISVVIPCYNETQRLRPMLDEALAHLSKNHPSAFELLLIDDGSSDNTIEFALAWAQERRLAPGVMKCVRLEKNRGKGGAVKHGLMNAGGRFVLFVDADGASRFEDMDRLKRECEGIAIGLRAHMVSTDAVVKRSFVRNFLMYSLHVLVYVFGIREIKDTQCGFKMFSREAVRRVMPGIRTEGWIFDVEILMVGLRLGVKVAEVGISWHEVGGSKVDLARDSINMAVDLVVIRLGYLLGVYTTPTSTPKTGSS